MCFLVVVSEGLKDRGREWEVRTQKGKQRLADPGRLTETRKDSGGNPLRPLKVRCSSQLSYPVQGTKLR